MSLVQEALEFATMKHQGQIRIFGGEAYIMHPIAVAMLIRKYKQYADNIEALKSAALLHDVLELPNTKYKELPPIFDYEIASLVLEVTTNREMKNAVGNKKEYLAYKLLHMTEDALDIKLCDRLDNTSDYKLWTEDFRERKVEETEFILNFIEENRDDLTDTHREIINDIRIVLSKAKIYIINNTSSGSPILLLNKTHDE